MYLQVGAELVQEVFSTTSTCLLHITFKIHVI